MINKTPPNYFGELAQSKSATDTTAAETISILAAKIDIVAIKVVIVSMIDIGWPKRATKIDVISAPVVLVANTGWSTKRL